MMGRQNSKCNSCGCKDIGTGGAFACGCQLDADDAGFDPTDDPMEHLLDEKWNEKFERHI